MRSGRPPCARSRLPADAFVVGEPVMAAAITYSGHPRAGLTLWGVRGDRRFSVGLANVAFPPGSATTTWG